MRGRPLRSGISETVISLNEMEEMIGLVEKDELKSIAIKFKMNINTTMAPAFYRNFLL
jgi:hypothetical protein